MNNLMDKIVSLAKRRGFIFPGSEIYGGLANSWDYGELGLELKNNIKQLWWKKFVHERDDMTSIDAAVIMNPKIWEASGHLKEFTDPLMECKKCHNRFREDDFISLRHPERERRVSKSRRDSSPPKADQNDFACPNCGGAEFSASKKFNLLFKTFLGPTEDASSTVYLRPEIAQAMFVDFKNVLDTTRRKLPFGIASQGKVFRNEITPGNFIFRTREFDLMEFEYFVRAEEWKQWFDYWLSEMKKWLALLGINSKKLHFTEMGEGERAHYSKRTIDIEYEYPFGQKELYGLAYRTDFDLKRHFKEAPYKDPETGEEFYPHVIEPTFGLDRSLLVVLLEAYHEEKERLVLKLPAKLAPYKAAVFPLLANKPKLVELARKIYESLKSPVSGFQFPVVWDDRGNIGKRYYSQDEIGTPFCVTVDFESLEKNDITVRDRDTMKQERVPIVKLAEFIVKSLSKQ